jgi:hypothetical protein
VQCYRERFKHEITLVIEREGKTHSTDGSHLTGRMTPNTLSYLGRCYSYRQKNVLIELEWSQRQPNSGGKQ